MQSKKTLLQRQGMRVLCVFSAVLVVSVLLLPQQIWGQAVSATLLGTVTDKSGAAVPNATVQILEVTTGITHSGVTNGSGNYTFPDLTPGTYTVTANAQGFEKETRPNIDVVVNTSTRVDFALTPGSISQTVTVTGAPPIMQTDRADVSMNLES